MSADALDTPAAASPSVLPVSVPPSKGARTGRHRDDTPQLANAVSPETIGAMYEAFLKTGTSAKELSIEYGVPLRVIVRLMEKHSWPERRAALELSEIQKAEGTYRAWTLENKRPVAEAHLKVSKALIDQLERVLAEVQTKEVDQNTSAELRRLAEALKSAADVGARVVGMTDTPVGDLVRTLQKDKGAQKQMLVYINNAPGNRDVGGSRVIDVEDEGDADGSEER